MSRIYSKIIKKYKILILFILCGQIISCQVELPIKKLALAKQAISRADQVKAEKYAKEEIKLAKQNLFNAHKFIKEEKGDEAGKAADNALENANKAIEKSLPLLAKDKLIELEAILADAEEKKISELAKDEFDISKTFHNEAKDLYAQESYWDSYLKSQEGINKLQAALTIVMAKVPELREQMTEIQDNASEIKAGKGDEYASEELGLIEKSLKIAENDLDEGNVYAAITNINKAKDALEVANEKGKKYFAFQKIENAEKSIAEIKKSVFKKDFKTEIAEIDTIIAAAKTKFDNKEYSEASSEADNALEMIDQLKIALVKKSEEQKIVSDKTEKSLDIKDENGFPKEYIVELNRKDRVCLWKISLKYYKNARLWPLIYMANRDKIKDPDLIFPGQKFVIPAVPKKGDRLPNSDFRVEKALQRKEEEADVIPKESVDEEVEAEPAVTTETEETVEPQPEPAAESPSENINDDSGL